MTEERERGLKIDLGKGERKKRIKATIVTAAVAERRFYREGLVKNGKKNTRQVVII